MPLPKPSMPNKPVRLRVHKGDTVQVITGKDVTKRGEVLAAYPKRNQVLVKGVNMITRHTKDRQTNRPGAFGGSEVVKGGRVEKEAPMLACKVMVVCPSCHKPTRVGLAFRDGADKPARRKYRVCKHPECGKPLDAR